MTVLRSLRALLLRRMASSCQHMDPLTRDMDPLTRDMDPLRHDSDRYPSTRIR